MSKVKAAAKIHDAMRAAEAGAWKRASAYVVLSPTGEHVGSIKVAHPADGAGRMRVYVADWTRDRPADVDWADFTRWQAGAATGYGYDKFTAAIAGLTVAGFTFADHASPERPPYPEGLDHYPAGFVPPPLFRMANPRGDGGWASCYRVAGLDGIREAGFTVIQAL